MKRIIFAGFLFIIFSSFYAFEEPSHSSFDAQGESIFARNKDDCTQTTSTSSAAQWAKTYGGTIDDEGAELLSIHETSDGGYIVLGKTRSFGAGDRDFWILKLTSSGDIEWQRTYGGRSRDSAWSIQKTSDGGYIVAGDTESFGAGDADIWILKLDSSGDIEWQRTYGGTDWDGWPYIQEASDGGYIVAGCTESFGAGDGDIWVLKLNSSGDIEWQRTYGGSLEDNYCHIQLTSDGGYIVAGCTESFGAGDRDFWILKLDSSGDIEWQRTYGGTFYEWATDIKLTSDGGYIVSGATLEFGRYGNFLILKLDSSGDIEWQRAYGGGFMDYPWSIKQTSDGGYIVAGYTESFDQQNRWLDISVLKLTSSGDIEWEETYGGGADDLAWSIQQTSDGGYIVAGSTYPLSGDGGDVFGAGGEDLLVLKIDPNGDIPDCALSGSPTNSVNETSYFPSDTSVTPMNTNVIPQNTNIQPQESDAIIYNLCPGPHTLTLSVTTGGTTNPEPGTYTYDGGTYVTIEAIPNSGYEFTGWSGDASGATNPITIAMDSDKSITANFSAITAGNGDDTGKKGGCFIATACYGTPMAEEVKTLCAFRDQYLLTNPIGRDIVELYYRLSPEVANFIRDKEDLKTIVRECLKPFIWIISKAVK
ncbi:MAG: hypothetical protein NWE90_05390 [Candidatus Bathyarchaeota archaeon]|nr:hypothetical protein [Candidatus Bathyarchaeota archaeon]